MTSPATRNQSPVIFQSFGSKTASHNPQLHPETIESLKFQLKQRDLTVKISKAQLARLSEANKIQKELIQQLEEQNQKLKERIKDLTFGMNETIGTNTELTAKITDLSESLKQSLAVNKELQQTNLNLRNQLYNPPSANYIEAHGPTYFHPNFPPYTYNPISLILIKSTIP